MTEHLSDPIDVHVGSLIRHRRRLLGMSQDELAQHLGVTFQQVQKYENGKNRISASMMFRAAAAMNVEPGFFFGGLSHIEQDALLGEAERQALDWLRSPEAADLARVVVRLSPTMRAAVMRVARSLEDIA